MAPCPASASLAFCEASGKRLVRHSGTDAALVDLACRNASAIGAGHAFIVFLGDGCPVNVLNAIKAVPEVCRIYCASANPTEVIVAETAQGRGIVGVVDGFGPLGVEMTTTSAGARICCARSATRRKDPPRPRPVDPGCMESALRPGFQGERCSDR